MPGLFNDALGSIGNIFRVGLTGLNLKSSAGSLLVRNTADSADAPIQASQLRNTGTSVLIGTTNVLTFQQNASQSGGLTVILPAAKATDGQVLAQKAGTAAGVIEFEFISSGSTADKSTRDTTTLAFGSSSPLSLFTLPANAVIDKIRIVVDTAFNGTPSLSIGITGTTSKYVASTQVDLTVARSYEIYPDLAASGSSEALIATYAAGGASSGTARILVDYAIPS
jgi:hypothetical protein